MSWASLEPSQGVYDFSAIDNIVGQLDSINQKLTLLLGGSASNEPSYIVNTPGLTTYKYKNPKTRVTITRAVPWDPYLLQRFQAFTKALGDHLIYNRAVGQSTPLRDHPMLANVNFGLPGLGKIRDLGGIMAKMPGYTREGAIHTVITSLHAQTDQFPNKFVMIGLFVGADSTASPPLWDAIRTAILNEFDGTKNPKVGFWQEVLSASKNLGTGVIIGYPLTANSGAPLYLSKNSTFIGFQALQAWDNPFLNPSKTAHTTPTDGLEYGYDTYGCTYFELYVNDIDDQRYWSSFQQWHDFLITAP